MTTIQFYHLTSTPFERALPKLVEKAYAHNYRVLLVADTEDKVQLIDQMLWTYSPGAFLPHGTGKEEFPERQPVFITTRLEAPNSPNLLFVTEGSTPDDAARFERIIDLFDGHNPESVEKARQRFKAYKDAGHELSYFAQKEDGSWEKRGSS